MIIEGTDPQTGKTVEMTCVADSEDEIRDLLSFDLSEDALKRRLHKLNISADAKSILFTIARRTIKIGALVVKIGRKILDIATKVLGEFPMASIGTIFGAILGYLVASIPIIGLVFGPFVGPLAIAFGFAVGATQDLSNQALARRIKASLAAFDNLKVQN